MAGKRKTFGFGFNPAESLHHFLVHIPTNHQDPVVIMERFDQTRLLGLEVTPDTKVKLPYEKWQAIADTTKTEFNRYLHQSNCSSGHWKPGFVPLTPLLGKELVLLAWAIEDADPVLIPRAIQNWLGLSREERWYLFTMTNATTGHYERGRGKGWRQAVRYALTENPVSA